MADEFTPIQKVFIVEDLTAIKSMYRELSQWIEEALAKAPNSLKIVYFNDEFPVKDKKLLSLLMDLRQEKNYKLLGDVSIKFVEFVEQWLNYVWKDNRHVFTLFDTIYKTQNEYLEKYAEQAKRWKEEQDKLFAQFANPKLNLLREQMGIAPQIVAPPMQQTPQEQFDGIIKQVFPNDADEKLIATLRPSLVEELGKFIDEKVNEGLSSTTIRGRLNMFYMRAGPEQKQAMSKLIERELKKRAPPPIINKEQKDDGNNSAEEVV